MSQETLKKGVESNSEITRANDQRYSKSSIKLILLAMLSLVIQQLSSTERLECVASRCVFANKR